MEQSGISPNDYYNIRFLDFDGSYGISKNPEKKCDLAYTQSQLEDYTNVFKNAYREDDLVSMKKLYTYSKIAYDHCVDLIREEDPELAKAYFESAKFEKPESPEGQWMNLNTMAFRINWAAREIPHVKTIRALKEKEAEKSDDKENIPLAQYGRSTLNEGVLPQKPHVEPKLPDFIDQEFL